MLNKNVNDYYLWYENYIFFLCYFLNFCITFYLHTYVQKRTHYPLFVLETFCLLTILAGHNGLKWKRLNLNSCYRSTCKYVCSVIKSVYKISDASDLITAGYEHYRT